MKSVKSTIKTTLIITLFVYISMLGFLYANQRNMLYYPDTAIPEVINNSEVIKVQTPDGLNLKAWWFNSQTPNAPVVLIFHGNSGNISSRAFKAQAFLDIGASVLLAEYRGYGGNPGTITEDGLYEDARSYIAWLKSTKGIKPKQIILYGESLGTGIAVQMATEFKTKAVILEAPYSTIPDVAKQTYFYVPVDLLMKDQYRSIDKIKDIYAPLLIIHGNKDRVIPISLSEKLYRAANDPKTFIAILNAGHNDLYDMGAQLHIQEFLRNIAK